MVVNHIRTHVPVKGERADVRYETVPRGPCIQTLDRTGVGLSHRKNDDGSLRASMEIWKGCDDKRNIRR